MTSYHDIAHTFVNRHQNDLVCIKNKQSLFIDANDAFLSFFGMADIEQLYGKTDYDLPCAPFAGQYIENDKEAMLDGELQIFEPTVQYNGRKKLLLSHKYSFIHPDSKQSCILAICKIIENKAFEKSIDYLNQYQMRQIKISNSLFNMRVNKYAKVALSERELDVLYYLLHGLSQKQVANKLNLSTRTVEDHVDHIKSKINCSSKHQLFEFAIKHNLINIIPRHLLNETK